MTKFKVLIDGRKKGVLKKWGDSEEFEVSPGLHTVAVKSFAV